TGRVAGSLSGLRRQRFSIGTGGFAGRACSIRLRWGDPAEMFIVSLGAQMIVTPRSRAAESTWLMRGTLPPTRWAALVRGRSVPQVADDHRRRPHLPVQGAFNGLELAASLRILAAFPHVQPQRAGHLGLIGNPDFRRSRPPRWWGSSRFRRGEEDGYQDGREH